MAGLINPRRPVCPEVTTLISHLSSLRSCIADRQNRSKALADIGARATDNAERLLASLTNLSPPPTGRLRQLVRNSQALLRALAEDIAPITEHAPDNPSRDTQGSSGWLYCACAFSPSTY